MATTRPPCASRVPVWLPALVVVIFGLLHCAPLCHATTIFGYESYHEISRALAELNEQYPAFMEVSAPSQGNAATRASTGIADDCVEAAPLVTCSLR